MALRYQYTTIDTLFAKLVRDIGEDWSEGDVIEWTAGALNGIGAPRAYQEAVYFSEVKNHTCELPNGIHNIIQIARDNDFRKQTCPADVVKSCTSPFRTVAPDCDGCPTTDENGNPIPDYLVLDAQGMPLNDFDVAYYRPFFDLIGEYYLWNNSNLYKTRYTPIRISASSFASAVGLVCVEKNQSVYQHVEDEYTIVAGKTLRFSFRDGFIALAYNKQLIDTATGYPMIPDNYSYLEAITMYVAMKLKFKECFAGREGSCAKAKELDQQWQWYCKQSKNLEMMPHGIDEYQNLTDQQYLLPRNNRYYGFFGKLNQPEKRIWNNR